jgi:hypothetical protein
VTDPHIYKIAEEKITTKQYDVVFAKLDKK